MNKRVFKILALSAIVVLLVSLACCSLVACGGKKNDKEYTLADLAGSYQGNDSSYPSNMYYLTITSSGSAKCTSQTYQQIRAGMVVDVFSGEVSLTSKGITIDSYSGYIETNSEGKIVIYLNTITFVKN